MKRVFAIGFALMSLFATQEAFSQYIEKLPFGDMEQWQTRVIKESFLLGGDTKNLYDIAPKAEIKGATPYRRNDISPWASSNVLASPAGIVKTSCSVRPEKRGDGYCARLEVVEERCKAIGIVNIVVVASGSVFLGGMAEPVKTAKDPMSKLDQGIPFTKRPIALQFDYKTKREKQVYRATGSPKISKLEGTDNAEAMMLLIHRWEDEDGNVYAKRVGTAIEKFGSDVTEWVNDYQIPVHYGDITKEPFYKSYMGLIDASSPNPYYTTNSKGKMVPVQEIGWAEPGVEPTHMILKISSSDLGPYVGTVGSVFWLDNVELVYDKKP
ncbi:MAG: PCMD domain-containing protein [Coprobacter sp.]|nr:PCMD domain-containing protein [Coprobacter sp.]